jgi:hypothetical protein
LAWRDALRPAKKQLLKPLGAIYRDTAEKGQPRTYATETLADYAADDPNVLFDLLADAEQFQFRIIFGKFAIQQQAIALARHTPTNANGNSKVTDISASFMKHSFGRVVIGAVGVIIIAVGLYRVSKGLKMDVDDELDMSGMSPARRRWSERLGAVGEVGRGIGFALVGFFLLRSAMTYDPNQATGLDGALRRLATHSWGVFVVAIVGIGFAAYGIFCLATFTHRRLQAP